ncbi:hypothetical protein GCM10022224_016730 [Nonomuraea antimicrobica]|uniref:Peptidase inhibitor family I36 n=1 Tax=Nonomuraea antimicrobica TaxID=561173 RepID=A0ABP7BBL2_9ACTN
MRRQTIRRAGVVALAMTGLLGIGLPVQANAEQLASSCLSSFCLYEHDNYTGTEQEFLFTSNGCVNAGTLNNKASSMRNPSAGRIQFYNSANCAGSYGYVAAPRSVDSDLTNNGFDNLTSSVKRVNP